MNTLQNIIERCHQRHEKPSRQRKTIITPALYKPLPYHFKVRCARGYAVMLDELEKADLSFMPIGRAPENDRGPKDLGGDRFLKRQGTRNWRRNRWLASWGIQIYTGIPSERYDARWHDINFTYEAICAAPDAVLACVETLIKATTKPLLTLTKSGGLRFSCRVPDYLHPDTQTAKLYIYKHSPTPENPHHRDVYLEILGENGYSRWDARYEILLGDLLDPPVIAKELLFAPINVLRAALHVPEPPGEMPPETAFVVPPSLGSHDLDLAKEAFLKRDFSYLQQDADFHHWIFRSREGKDIYAWLWEDQGTVWVRASAPISGLPMRATPITSIWDDTGIAAPASSGVPMTDKMLAVREGKLSPLAIKRPASVISRKEPRKTVYGTHEENAAQVRRVFQMDARVLGVNTEIGPGTNSEVESYLRDGGAICLNIASRHLAETIEQRYKARKLPSFARWRARMYRWQEVKNIPIDERMATPFERGNPCEDADRCRAFGLKGGEPEESICPHCPVYTECQARGYLSQIQLLQRAKAQISPTHQLFLDPQHAKAVEPILNTVDATERICMIDHRKITIGDLFLECELSKKVLEQWAVNWGGKALGNFANALLNALEPQSQPINTPIVQVRAAVHAFQQYEDVLVWQMCNINVPGKVVARAAVDTETGQELARFCIEFEGGTSAYIPVDANAEDKLKTNGTPCFSFESFALNENIQIPMSMAAAIELGILDTETVEKILEFPTVCRHPNWTYWHQLKRFFTHYTRDTDAPMQWDNEKLKFYVPPVLHPSVKHLLLISPTLSERYLREVFPDEKIEFVGTKPTPWLPGNKVFQLRTGIYSHHIILNDHDNKWDVPSLSKIGERFFLGISAEIERDPSVKHAIIINRPINRLLVDLAEKQNVCFVKDFKMIEGQAPNFEEAEVVWIVGTPYWPQSTIWWHAQMLFGNDEEPLYYEGAAESDHYKDERIQHVYQQHVVGLLTRIVEQVGLNHWQGKKVVLMTSLALPNITDRPETLFFDWEDFEIAGGLDKLSEVIATREHFETEAANLTAESGREKVEQVLGCSSRQANRMLRKLRGGKLLRVPFREQILSLLAKGETRTAKILTSIDGHPKAIDNELRNLVDKGEIVRVRRGVYTLPET